MPLRSLTKLSLPWLFAVCGCLAPSDPVDRQDAGVELSDASAVAVDAGAIGSEADADLPADDAGLPDASAERFDASAPAPLDAGVVPVDDGAPTRVACTSHYGSALTKTHGRLDGYLVAIVPPGNGGCNVDSDHVHLQVRMDGAIYDVAVNVYSTSSGSPDVDFAEADEALVDGPWAEGWHSTDALDYVQFGLHAADFVATSKSALVERITEDLATANHVSVFATGYGGTGAHLVHRNGGGRDGAIVVRPLSAAPHYLMFHFSDQTF
ncbi:MAG TPA: hypothetical protein VGK67_28730 [Myxococcales bacterium]|jgi:hypothetical protein